MIAIFGLSGINGLTLDNDASGNSSGSTIQDLDIKSFTGIGIQINSTDDTCERLLRWDECYWHTGHGPTSKALLSARGAPAPRSAGPWPATGNLISGNSAFGIEIGASCLVEGNEIGTNQHGTAALPNAGGIGVNSSGATIGGSTVGAANLISGNAEDGIVPRCVVPGRGERDRHRPGRQPPRWLTSAMALMSTHRVPRSAGTSLHAANAISGNGAYGIEIEGASCLVEGNEIGTDLTGTVALGNISDGIYVGGTGMGATIGGSASGDATRHLRQRH